MRKLRITLTATAFFLAIGSVFAFTPSRPSSNTVVVKGMAATCPVSVVSNQCRLIVPGYICTYIQCRAFYVHGRSGGFTGL